MLMGIGRQGSRGMRRTVSVLRFSFVLMLLLVTTSQFLVFVTFAEVGESEAASALADAEGEVTLAYLAVLKVEEAGANVSGLMVRLNESGGFLARARMAYRLEDFDGTVSFAALSGSIGVEVQDEAVRLKNTALSESAQRMMFTMTASVLGIALIALASFWVWRLLKERYGQSAVA